MAFLALPLSIHLCFTLSKFMLSTHIMLTQFFFKKTIFLRSRDVLLPLLVSYIFTLTVLCPLQFSKENVHSIKFSVYCHQLLKITHILIFLLFTTAWLFYLPVFFFYVFITFSSFPFSHSVSIDGVPFVLLPRPLPSPLPSVDTAPVCTGYRQA